MFKGSSGLAGAVFCAILVLFGGRAVQADISIGGDAGQILPADPSSWTTTTAVLIGADSAGTGLVSMSGGSQANSQDCTIGSSDGSTGSLTVTGAGSTWTLGRYLTVADHGAGTLVITDGGKVSASSGSYIAQYAGSTGAVTVSGAGSIWTSNGIYAGEGSSSLTVQDGGIVSTSVLGASLTDLHGNGLILANGLILDGELLLDATHSASSIPFGTGGTLNATLTSTSLFGAGYRGDGTLTIAQGVKVNSSMGYLGYNTGANGTATVSGIGSSWTIGNALYVGRLGSGSLTVENGAVVTTKTFYGSLSDLRGNGIIETTGLIIDADLHFDATHSTQQTLAFGSGGILTASLGTSAALGVGYRSNGTLDIGQGANVSNASGYLGYRAGSSGTATVSGAGSTWTISSSLQVGESGAGALVIADGAIVTTGSAVLGNLNQSAGTASLTGGGTKWIITNDLTLANRGTGVLTLGQGATLSCRNGSIGNTSASGTATVSGLGSTWTTAATLMVGSYGAGVLNIQGGATVTSTDASVGYGSAAAGSVTVTGSGSSWANSNELYIGRDGSGKLAVENGGTVGTKMLYAALGDLQGNGNINTNGLIADGDLSFDAAHSAGPAQIPFGTGGVLNAKLDGTTNFGVGYRKSGSLSLTGGAQLRNYDGFLAYKPGSMATALISGAGSAWNNARYLWVGNSGSATLTIADGATVTAQTTNIGLSAGSSGIVEVRGANSALTTNNVFTVNAGTVTVAEGGSLVSNVGKTNPGSTIRITGSGSTWTSTASLVQTDRGPCTLIVENGGVINTGTFCSSLADVYGDGVINAKGASLDTDLVFDSSYNTRKMVTVPFGTGGVINIQPDGTGDLGAGYRGRGTLSIVGGAKVRSYYGRIADGWYTDGSAAFVKGIGSTWTVQQVDVGYGGSGTLTIVDGGKVSALTSNIGTRAPGKVIVSGTGSTWNNTSNLNVGYSQGGTMIVTGGGRVTSGTNSTIGCMSGSAGTAIISGMGSTWLIGGTLYVGLTTSNTGILTIADGAVVTLNNLYVNSKSSVNLFVTNDALLSLTYQTQLPVFQNDGKINFYADAFLDAGTYAPITMKATGSGSYSALGGTVWSGQMQVSAATALVADQVDSLSSGERLLIRLTDGRPVGVSFGLVPTGSTCSGRPMSGAELLDLAPAPGEAMLSAWTFTSNYAGNALLAYDLGKGASNLKVWRYANGQWNAYVPEQGVIYGGDGIARFVVSGFSGYAVTGIPVPEPTGAALILLAAMGALYRRRGQRA